VRRFIIRLRSWLGSERGERAGSGERGAGSDER